MKKSIGALLAAGAAFLLYNRNQTRKMRIATPTIRLAKAKEEIRITQISDFHSNRFVDPHAVANEITKFAPHFIVLTGDLVSEDDVDFDTALSLAHALVYTGIPVYAIIGNHEQHNALREDLYEGMIGAGVRMLRNEAVHFPVEGVPIALSGVDFPALQEWYDRASHTVSEEELHILLCHSPSEYKKLTGNLPDLVICGHTHGGQVRVPLLGAIIVPSQGFFAKMDKGQYVFGDTTMYIDTGLGNTRLDLRTFNPIQFTNMKLVAHR